ncbi:acyl-CoA thioesterase [Natribacillus halophilus]|uniref:Acyl-CoA hydrolase n=1 Tax=Natribacillus halophilus TaxID=549003 RepID=A0A1G8NN10_9BACI|nr:acyl-CoA thioesterase [Natribacillus halophilus]SDI80880.1 Acyl-CoA hydrolase [Natribacillus halophilus]
MSKQNESRSMSRSHTLQSHLVSPSDTNHLQTIFGGNVLAYIDEAAAITAMRHSGEIAVTASVDSVDFHSTVKSGDLVNVEAWIAKTGRTSMVVYVHVSVENPATGDTKTTTTSFVTMVAINQDRTPVEVPAVYAETEEEEAILELGRGRKRNE